MTDGSARLRRLAWGVTAVLVLVWSVRGLDIDPNHLFGAPGRLFEFFTRMVPPDMSVARTVFISTVETLQIVLVGTAMSIVAGLALGLLAASNLTPRWVSDPAKWLLAIIRGVPVILLALIFVSSVGLGPLPGVLTIAVHATGMLGKFYAESFEGVPRQPLVALTSAGANWVQAVRFGVVRQALPNLIRDTLFRFEMNLRESLVLGLVGAGGVGFYIQTYIRAFQYQRVATLVIVVLVLVLTVEQATSMIRRRLMV